MCQKQETDKKTVWYTEFGYWIDPVNKRFSRNHFMPIDEAKRFLAGVANVGVYQTAFYYDNPDIEKANLYGDFYLDFDDEDDFETVRRDAITAVSFLKTVFKLTEKDIYIFFSGRKGVHITVPAKVLGVAPTPSLNAHYKEIAENLLTFLPNKTLDRVIYDNRRLFRIPNSQHEKTGLHKTELSLHELRTLSLASIQWLAQEIAPPLSRREHRVNTFAKEQYKRYAERVEQAIADRERSRSKRSNNDLKYVPPCVTHLLENGCQRGARNNTTAALTSFIRATGKSEAEALAEITEWNAEKNKRPLTAFEIKRTVASIYSGQRMYGCGKLKELSVCNEGACKLKRKTVGDNERVRLRT